MIELDDKTFLVNWRKDHNQKYAEYSALSLVEEKISQYA